MDRKTEEKILFGLVFLTLVSTAIYMSLGPSNVNVKAYTEQTMEQRVGKLAAKYVKENVVPPSSTVYWGEVEKSGKLYEVELEIYDGKKMRKTTSYITEDLNLFFPSSVDMTKTSRPIEGGTAIERATDFARKYIFSYGERIETKGTSYESGFDKVVLEGSEYGELVLFVTEDGKTVYPQHSYIS